MKNFRKNFNLKHCVIRFIMAWCFVCLIEAVWIAVTAKKKMSTLSYVGEVPVALHILTIAVLFAVLYILFEKIKNIRTEKMLLVLVTVLYAFTAVIQTPDVWFCTGMVLLLTFTFSYAFEPEACTDIDMDNTAGTATQAGTSQVNTQKKGELSGRRGLHIICIVSGVLLCCLRVAVQHCGCLPMKHRILTAGCSHRCFTI